MYKIVAKKKLAQSITQLDILAPEVVRSAKAGQFVVVIPDEKGERIPLTIAKIDKARGELTIIFQEVGFSTFKLASFSIGDHLFAVLGPLGHPTKLQKFGVVLCVAGGVGIAEMLPVAKALKDTGNKVVGIVGARSKDLLILEDELSCICEPLLVATDDGSKGRKGFVTDILVEELEKLSFSYVYSVGPVKMMKRVSDITRLKAIPTVVSLNPVMVDATGMCGVCRCRVDGKTVFGCVDGPEFDAHKVDFDELEMRLSAYQEEENKMKKVVL
jgi:ferredoxin/flavodoxin---NADP+ reductase